MPLSFEAQALFDHAKNSLPRWLTESASSATEWLFGFTEVFDEIRGQGQNWIDITYLANASGSELDQHAADRGTSRRAGESDATLRQRLRTITDALTEPALLTGANAILEANSLFRYFKVAQYTSSGWNTKLTALTGAPGDLTLRIVNDGASSPFVSFSGSAVTVHVTVGTTTQGQVEAQLTAFNNGWFAITTPTSFPGFTLTSADIFGPAPFQLAKIVSLRRDRAHMHTVGSCRSFFNRGYRMTNIGRPMGFIVILPFGTTAVMAKAVSEYLRQNGPAGYIYYVERRLNP